MRAAVVGALVAIGCVAQEAPVLDPAIAIHQALPDQIVAGSGAAFAPGEAERLVFLTQPGDSVAGSPFSPAVSLAAVDALGRVVDAPIFVAIESDSALDGMTGVSGVGEVEIPGLRATSLGEHTLVASAEGFEPVTSRPFEIRAGKATRLGFQESPAAASAGVLIEPWIAVRLEDAFGNPVTGSSATMELTIGHNPNADALEGEFLASTSDGVALFGGVVLHRVAQDLTLLASAEGLEAAESPPIAVSGGVAVGLGFLGPPDDGVAGEPLAPVTVVARDTWGNRAVGFDGTVAVSTGLTGAGTQLAGKIAVQAFEGLAVFDDLVLEKARPFYTLKALSQELEHATSAPFDVVAAPPSALVFDASPPFGCVGHPLQPTVRVGVLDAFGNATVGAAQVTLSLAGGSLDGEVQTTAKGGIARFPLAVPAEPGTEVALEATAPGLDGTTSDLFDVHECEVVAGSAAYERVPASTDGLDYDAAFLEPIRGAEVALLDPAGDLLAESATGELGEFVLAFPPPAPAGWRVRVASRAEYPPSRVQDNTAQGALYVLETPELSAESEWDGQVVAASGWTGKKYTEPRAAAPFAILDTARRAAQKVLAVRDLTLPESVFNWSVDNRPEAGDLGKGQITSTHFSPFFNHIYLMGKQNAQTDEYDRHTIVHEWTHWLEHSLGRSDSFGGVHWLGAQIEMRLAFGEGIADAMPGIVLDPETVYAMTFGKKQSKGWGFDVDDNAGGWDPHPGWYSEGSVASIVYDVFDPADEEFDHLELGLGPILDVLVGHQVDTDAMTSLFSFLHGMKQLAPQESAALDALAAKHALGPVIDDWGTGETNNAGWDQNLPVYRDFVVNGPPLDLPLAGEPPAQFVYTTRFLRFTGNGGGVTIAVQAWIDVDLFVFRRGELLGHTVGNETNSIGVQTEPLARYVVAIRGVQNGQKINDCTVSVTSP